MKNPLITTLLTVAFASFAALQPAHAETWTVQVDTSSLAGRSGWLDLQFNPADLTAPAGSATVTGLASTGPAWPDGSATGDVIGNPTSTLVLGNQQALNDWLQGLVFGTTLSFSLDIAATAAPGSGAGTAFSLSLYDSSFNSLLADPLWGASLVINVDDSARFSVLAQTAPVSLNASPVPEPNTAGLALAGLLAISAFRLHRATRTLPHG